MFTIDIILCMEHNMPGPSARYRPKTIVGGIVKRRIRKTELAPSTAKAVRAVVNKAIADKAENKLIGTMVEDNVLHNSPIGPADCEPVIMEISQGVDARSRTGDRITPKVLKVKGVVTLNTTSPPTTTTDIYARVLILAQKDVKTGAQVLGGSVDTSALLRAGFGGGADQIPYSGDPENTLMDINREKFRVYYDKVIKLSQVAEGSVEQNSRYSATFAYTFKKKNLPRFLTYDENNGDWCNNFAPFLAIGYAYSTGAPDSGATTKLNTHVYSQLQYEDM